jgi:hypothetical protein
VDAVIISAAAEHTEAVVGFTPHSGSDERRGRGTPGEFILAIFSVHPVGYTTDPDDACPKGYIRLPEDTKAPAVRILLETSIDTSDSRYVCVV